MRITPVKYIENEHVRPFSLEPLILVVNSIVPPRICQVPSIRGAVTPGSSIASVRSVGISLPCMRNVSPSNDQSKSNSLRPVRCEKSARLRRSKSNIAFGVFGFLEISSIHSQRNVLWPNAPSQWVTTNRRLTRLISIRPKTYRRHSHPLVGYRQTNPQMTSHLKRLQ